MVCAWCTTPIAADVWRPGFEHNYGMCRGCVEEQIALLKLNARRGPARRQRARNAEGLKEDSRAREATP